jgi:hypothetical protein
MAATDSSQFARTYRMAIVDRSTTGAGLRGRGGNWLDATERRETGVDLKDKNPHLAKVRVAGSNPVFRSIVPGQG